ncbi:hypothetical protein [Saccharolobus islandicus]|uniref:Uncharacterized protein n=2 Tax=Saccharolobus islandicus TaxID=43080 RepID=M9UCP7_SACIS|nr:hypothetical protein [Sulfolobus islandicus]ADX83928.1 conserved hypothetical protein [Sulfolobus islandicus HVE10/4]AGJ63912.1 Hypothetical Protein SiL_2479 [Sulfolobus islandicus LAL14/1]WCM37384.1 hypothetical protein GO599_07780 [Sulfolobus islandicus]
MNPFKKEKTYPKQVDLNKVVNEFVSYLNSDKWKVQQKVEGNKAIVQAQKGGILRDIIAADRALTFTFENTPQGLKVTAGVGSWIKNLAITAVETLLLSELFLIVDVPEMLWNKHVESQLMKKLDEIVQRS